MTAPKRLTIVVRALDGGEERFELLGDEALVSGVGPFLSFPEYHATILSLHTGRYRRLATSHGNGYTAAANVLERVRTAVEMGGKITEIE